MLGGQPNHGWQLNCTPDGSDFRLYDGSDLKTYLLMRWQGPDASVVVRLTTVSLLDSFAPVFSPCLCFISFLYLDLYVVGEDAMIS